MKMTVRELMEKIDGIELVMKELRMRDDDICDRAISFLEEYTDMLSEIKVDV